MGEWFLFTHILEFTPNMDRSSEYDIKSFKTFSGACDICDPLSIVWWSDLKILEWKPPVQHLTNEPTARCKYHTMGVITRSTRKLRFCQRSDGRYGFKKYFKLHCVRHSSSNENWFALSTHIVLATKFPTVFNSTLLCFSENSSKLCCIDKTFCQDVPHRQKTFKYIKTDTYITYGPYSRAQYW